MVEENANQEIEQKKLMSKVSTKLMAQKGFYDTKLCLKKGKRQSDAFVSECQ